jgi:hypothetical protein
MSERAAIVAWLRGDAEKFYCARMPLKDRIRGAWMQFKKPGGHHWAALDNAADAIEHGEHMKGSDDGPR